MNVTMAVLGKLHKLTHVFTIMSQQRFGQVRASYKPSL